MKWFWITVGAVTVAILVALYSGFFAVFEPTDWTTFLASVAAFLISVFALSKGRVPQPHWRVVEVFFFNDHTLSAVLKQIGPGRAENVEWQVKPPGEGWSARLATPSQRKHGVYERNDQLRVTLWYDEEHVVVAAPLGDYKVRVFWTCEPDTTKDRVKIFAANHGNVTPSKRSMKPYFGVG